MSRDPITMTAEMFRDAWIIMGIRIPGMMGMTSLPADEIALMISEKQAAMAASGQAVLASLIAPSADALTNIIAPFHAATTQNIVRLHAHQNRETS